MLRNAHRLINYTLGAVDGDAGKVRDFFFEEDTWLVRYVVADLGARGVLLAPAVLGDFDEEEKTLSVGLNREQVAGGLPLPADAGAKWAPDFAAPRVSAAGSAPAAIDIDEQFPAEGTPAGPGLRSARDLKGFSIHARDGAIGKLDGLILDDEDWLFRYLLVDTAKWWPGQTVVVATGWARGIDWTERSVRVDLTREAVRRSPPFDPSQPVNREYERKLYEYYGQEGYWR